MPTRLAAIAPNLDAALAAGDRSRCARAALAAAQQAAELCGLANAAPGLALTEGNLTKIGALVRTFDEEYLSHQQSGREHLTPFARARAASAIAFALRGEPHEAIYEAIVATDDPACVARIVNQVLKQDA